jgi:hypothetical protein
VVSGSAVLEDEYASVMVLAGRPGPLPGASVWDGYAATVVAGRAIEAYRSGPMTPDGPRVGLDEQ